MTFSVIPTAPGTITNHVWVAAKKTDPNAGYNSVSTATTVVDIPASGARGLPRSAVPGARQARPGGRPAPGTAKAAKPAAAHRGAAVRR